MKSPIPTKTSLWPTSQDPKNSKKTVALPKDGEWLTLLSSAVTHNVNTDYIIPCKCIQLFFSFFKSLLGKLIIVELKNDLALQGKAIYHNLSRLSVTYNSVPCMLTGTLHSVDQYLNIKLTNMTVVDPKKYPQLVGKIICVIWILTKLFPTCFCQVAVNNCFIRGSVVRYVHLPVKDVNLSLLNDSVRRSSART